jgi:hypothetical protein
MIAPEADVSHEVASWWRMAELCLPCHEVCGAATFAPSGVKSLDDEWRQWVEGMYVPVISPALLTLQKATEGPSLAALLDHDSALGAVLVEPARKRSLSCGREVLLGQTPPQGAKLLERLRETAQTKENCGHLATLFAVRGGVFHLPYLQLAGAYVLAEAVLGADSVGLTLPADRVAVMLGVARAAVTSGENPAHLVAV